MTEKTLVKPEPRALYKPFAMFEDLMNDIEQLWQRPWMPTFPWKARRLEKEGLSFMPRVDVFKKEDALLVRADLPGMKREEIHVELEGEDLILKGERKEEVKVEEENFYRAECMYGSFYRRLPLGFEVTPDKISAKLVNGVLEVTIPAPVEVKPKPKEIAIN